MPIARIPTKDWGKGLNKDQPPWELAPGFWSDCQNMRFRQGKAERVGGIASIITPSQTPYAMQAYPSGATRYLVYAGLTKAYSHDGTTEVEITPYNTGASKTITAFTQTTTTVTVTTGTAHGLATGNSVSISGAPKPDQNGTKTITVTSTTTFTYPDGASRSLTATALQLTTIAYVLLTGTPAVANFTGGIDDKITTANFNGVFLYNNPVDGAFYWDQVTSSRFVRFNGFAGNTADAMRVFKNFIVFIAPTVAGTKYRHAILWSDAADPGSVPIYFTASTTSLAGQQDTVSDREAIDGLGWGDTFHLYKGDTRYSLSYIGGNDVFDFKGASVYTKDDGLLAANCVVNTPKGQVFVSGSLDIRIHSGGESQSLVEGRMLKSFRARIDTTNRKRTFLEVNPHTNEVWVCFPESGQAACTKALVWNWNDDTWGERDLPSVTCACSGFIPTTFANSSRLLVGKATAIGLSESGATDFGSTITSMLERTGMSLDTEKYKLLQGSMPYFDASSNFTASVFHGSAPTQDGTVTYAAAATYTHNTTARVYMDGTSGRYLAWKMTTTAADTPSLRSIDFYISQQGGW